MYIVLKTSISYILSIFSCFRQEGNPILVPSSWQEVEALEEIFNWINSARILKLSKLYCIQSTIKFYFILPAIKNRSALKVYLYLNLGTTKVYDLGQEM